MNEVTEKKLISIIIPTFNRAHLIGETLDSIIAQTYNKWECIVVDDGSTDNTASLLEKYCEEDNRIQFHQRPNDRPKGANSCRNCGFELSKGTYVNWFDSDDLMDDNYLNDSINQLEKHHTHLVISNMLFFEERVGNIKGKIDNYPGSQDVLDSYISGKINIGTPTVVWKREIVKEFKFDESLIRAQELDFYFRVFQSKTLKFSFTRKALVFVRICDDSLTSKFKKINLDSLNSELKVRRSIVKFVNDENYSKLFKKKTIVLYNYTFLRLIRNYSAWIVLKEHFNFIKAFKVSVTLLLWELKFLILLVSFYFFKRDYRLKNHLNEVDG